MKHLFNLALLAVLPVTPMTLSAQEAEAAISGSPAVRADAPSDALAATAAAEPAPGSAETAANATDPGSSDDGAATADSSAADASPGPLAETAVEEPAFQIIDGYDVDLATYLWTHRPVVVFADSPADPQFQEQIDELLRDVPALVTRDVIVFVDTQPQAASALRKKLRPRGFMLVLIGKDGGVKLRKPLPWSVREITRSIDKFPTRLREVEERRGG